MENNFNALFPHFVCYTLVEHGVNLLALVSRNVITKSGFFSSFAVKGIINSQHHTYRITIRWALEADCVSTFLFSRNYQQSKNFAMIKKNFQPFYDRYAQANPAIELQNFSN